MSNTLHKVKRTIRHPGGSSDVASLRRSASKEQIVLSRETETVADSAISVEEHNLHALHEQIEQLSLRALNHTEEIAFQLSRNASYEKGLSHDDESLFAAFPDGVDSAIDDPQLLTAWLENRPEEIDSPGLSYALPGQAFQLSSLSRHFSVTEHLSLCRRLCELSYPTGEQADSVLLTRRLLGKPEECEADARGKVAYLHNMYTDVAFLRFARVFPQFRAQYRDSFTAVCEDVFNGLTEYAILPLENTQDGKLVRFYSLIEKYELKIVLTVEITTEDKQHATLFGLCRRCPLYPCPITGGTMSLEFIFWQDEAHATLSSLLNAAESADMQLSRVDCLPSNDEEKLLGIGNPFDVTLDFSVDRGKELLFPAFLLHLRAVCPTYLLIGIYNKL